jgi:hypothetical protein
MFASLQKKFYTIFIYTRFKLYINLLCFASIFKFFNINMFALLRNFFSNSRKCSLRFDIEENINIEAFAALRFDTLAMTAPH